MSPAAHATDGGSGAVSFGRPVLGPLAYTHFCMRYPDECRDRAQGSGGASPISLNEARMAELARVNSRVNHSIAPMHHSGDTSYDTWRISPRTGDCNDYAVTKRHLLIQQGWSNQALLLSEVITSWGEHHLILLVRTASGDFVLDNLEPRILRWDAVPYRWVRVQMPSQPSLWSTITSAPVLNT